MANNRITTIAHTSAYAVLYGLFYTVSLIPMPVLYLLASLGCFILYKLIGYRKVVVIQNISRSFPEKRYEEVVVVIKQFYASFTAYFAEMVKSISIPADHLAGKVKIENADILSRFIHEKRNVIVCMGHCGNWEMLNILPYKIPYDFYAVYKPLRSKVLDRLMRTLRCRFGVKLIPAKSVVRHILSQKTDPAIYLFLADQCPRITEEKYKFSLLHQKTYIFSGVEKLAQATQSAVVYLHMTQASKGHYIIKFILVHSQAGTTQTGEITQEYVNLLQDNIREEPAGWLWTHKRWKR